jgi:exopolysaccharide biosynthesis polyprenyl glycosylphosphotransferase
VVNGAEHVVPLEAADYYDEVSKAVGPRTLEILERRRRTARIRRRGWLIRRMLLLADVSGLLVAFSIAQLLAPETADGLSRAFELLIFAGTLPLWVVLAKLYGLYEADEERTDHSTVDELVGVFHLITVGTWGSYALARLSGLGDRYERYLVFWGLGVATVTAARVLSRGYSRSRMTYVQNAIIVGAGDVGQLIGRKMVQHPEYGINLVGFIDDEPKERRAELEHVTLLGPPERLPAIVRMFDIERVVIAFSREPHERTLELIRALSDLDVQVDLVPRLFEVIGPSITVHTVEGLPLVGLPPVRISRSSRVIKRALDVIGALLFLALTAPVFLLIAWRIKRDSKGPVFYRQKRLGMNRTEFTMLKFRTMSLDTDDTPHRDFIEATMSRLATPTDNGLYKLEREDVVTQVGKKLRRMNLDELPQLINVLRGDMSLVGPRPCLEYETEFFAPHHFERFMVPAGLTGLWQVTARAHATFGEALDMDVAYVRAWSLGLDLVLILRTTRQFLSRNGTR